MLIVYPVRDLDAAKAVYSAMLGTEPYADSPYYVGYRVGDLEVGLDPNGHKQGRSGPLPYQDFPDVAAALESLVAAGSEDADGNVTGLRQA